MHLMGYWRMRSFLSFSTEQDSGSSNTFFNFLWLLLFYLSYFVFSALFSALYPFPSHSPAILNSLEVWLAEERVIRFPQSSGAHVISLLPFTPGASTVDLLIYSTRRSNSTFLSNSTFIIIFDINILMDNPSNTLPRPFSQFLSSNDHSLPHLRQPFIETIQGIVSTPASQFQTPFSLTIISYSPAHLYQLSSTPTPTTSILSSTLIYNIDPTTFLIIYHPPSYPRLSPNQPKWHDLALKCSLANIHNSLATQWVKLQCWLNPIV